MSVISCNICEKSLDEDSEDEYLIIRNERGETGVVCVVCLKNVFNQWVKEQTN